jgi:hypothetical protein
MPLIQWILNNLNTIVYLGDGQVTILGQFEYQVGYPPSYSYEIAGTINIFGDVVADFTENKQFQAGDLKYYLSGGIANRKQEKSLGGLPSNHEVLDIVDNLFGKVRKEELGFGSELYRCMYIVNTGESTIQNVKVWISQNEKLSLLSIGVTKAIETQSIIFKGVSGGTFSLKYTTNINGIPVEQETMPITFVEDETTLSTNIQTALNALTYLGEVSVSTTFLDDQWESVVSFEGVHSYRYHSVLEFGSNSLTGTDLITKITIITQGSPVNTVATNIGFENQSPADVTFSTPDQSSAIEVGTLGPLDGFAVWFKRTTPSNLETSFGLLDSATLKIGATVELPMSETILYTE